MKRYILNIIVLFAIPQMGCNFTSSDKGNSGLRKLSSLIGGHLKSEPVAAPTYLTDNEGNEIVLNPKLFYMDIRDPSKSKDKAYTQGLLDAIHYDGVEFAQRHFALEMKAKGQTEEKKSVYLDLFSNSGYKIAIIEQCPSVWAQGKWNKGHWKRETLLGKEEGVEFLHIICEAVVSVPRTRLARMQTITYDEHYNEDVTVLNGRSITWNKKTKKKVFETFFSRNEPCDFEMNYDESGKMEKKIALRNKCNFYERQ